MENRIMTYKDCNVYLHTSKSDVQRCIQKDEVIEANGTLVAPWSTFVGNRVVRFEVPQIDNVPLPMFSPFDDMTVKNMRATKEDQRYRNYPTSYVNQLPNISDAVEDHIYVDLSDPYTDSSSNESWEGRPHIRRSGTNEWDSGSTTSPKMYAGTSTSYSRVHSNYSGAFSDDTLRQYPIWFDDQIASGWDYTVSGILYDDGDDWLKVHIESDTASSQFYYDAVGTLENPIASHGGIIYIAKENKNGYTRRAKVIVLATKRSLQSWYTSNDGDYYLNKVAKGVGGVNPDKAAGTTKILSYDSNSVLFVIPVIQYGSLDAPLTPNIEISNSYNESITVEIVPESGKDIDFAVYNPANQTGGGYWYNGGIAGNIDAPASPGDPDFQSCVSVSKDANKKTTIVLDASPFYTESSFASEFAHFYIYGTQCGYENTLSTLDLVSSTTASATVTIKQNGLTVGNSFTITVSAQGSLNINGANVQQMIVCAQCMIDAECGIKSGTNYDANVYAVGSRNVYYNKGISTLLYPVGATRAEKTYAPVTYGSTDRVYDAYSMASLGTKQINVVSRTIKSCDASSIGIKIELSDNQGGASTSTYSYSVNGNTLTSGNAVHINTTANTIPVSIVFDSSNVPQTLSPTIWFKITQETMTPGYMWSLSPEYAVVGFTFNNQ